MNEEDYNKEVKFPHWQRKCLQLAKENSCKWKKKILAYSFTGLVANMLAQQKCMQAHRPYIIYSYSIFKLFVYVFQLIAGE